MHGSPSVASLPTRSLVAEAENTWVQHFCNIFQRLYQPWARAIEELVAVRQEDPAPANRTEFLPTRSLHKRGHVIPGSFDVKAAWQNDDHVRIAGCQMFPCHPGRMLA